VSAAPIENGIVVFSEGKITAVGAQGQVQIPQDAEQIDCKGKRIYPGLFDASSQIGVSEIGSIAVTQDGRETGNVNPNAQVHVSVNPDSELIPTTRANGVLLAHVMPSSGLVSGQAAVLQLDGWTWEDLTLDAPTGVVMSWPSMSTRQGGFGQQATPEEQASARQDSLRAIEDLFDQASRYSLALEAAGIEAPATAQVARSMPAERDANGQVSANGQAQAGQEDKGRMSPPAYDAKLEATVPLLKGEIPLIVNANDAAQIQSAVAFAKRRGLKIIINGATDAGKILEFLAEHQVPVIINGTQRLPSGRDEAYDEAYSLPARLHEAGIAFALTADREAAFIRNLPYHAGNAIGFGLPEDAALRSVTLGPAQILGVADRVGSLETGKDATLIVTDGDIFETPTHVTHAWVQGRAVDLSSKHTRLNDKYKQRYGQE
jgi:imidazolonepropionase-like amidohydrolase